MSKFNIRNEVQRLQRRGWKFARIGSILYHYPHQDKAPKKGVYVRGEWPLKRELADILSDWDTYKRNGIIDYILDTASELEEKPPLDEINLTNGILNLKTRELRKHDPDFLSPVQINAAYNPLAKATQIKKFVEQVFPEDVTQLGYQIPGLLITPDTSFQKAFLLHGGGANGKSVYLGLLENFTGEANTTRMSLHMLATDRFATADLVGKLLNISADLPRNHISDTSMFKSIVGEDRIAAQKKFRDHFMFQPYSRLIFSANEFPSSDDDSEGYARRWLVIPFPITIKPDERDPKLLSKLIAPNERAGLLNLALDAYTDLSQKRTFSTGASTDKALNEFMEINDPVLGFCNERIQKGPKLEVLRSSLYEGYAQDMYSKNKIPLSRKSFNIRIRALHPEVLEMKSGGDYIWRGIGLNRPQPVGLFPRN